MSRRLHVILTNEGYERYRDAARIQQKSLSEWVRSSLRKEADSLRSKTAESKLHALHRALLYSFPAPDIEQMNEEIEDGYRSESL